MRKSLYKSGNCPLFPYLHYTKFLLFYNYIASSDLFKQYLLHSHKLKPSFRQNIDRCKRRIHAALVAVMHQNNTVLLRLIHRAPCHFIGAAGAPVIRVNICNRSKYLLLLFTKKLLKCC